MKIRDQSFYVINGWMVNQLGLKGRELHIYAIIYGFTQDRETEFSGSLSYIADWLGCTKKTAVETLKSLISKGLIEKNQEEICGVKVNYYKAILPPQKPPVPLYEGSVKITPPSVKTTQGSVKITPENDANYTGGSVKITPNSYIYNNNNIYTTKGEKEKSEITAPLNENPPEKIPFNKIKIMYNEICKSFPRCMSLTDNRKKAIAARWKEYGQGIAPFVSLFHTAEASSFLKGRNPRNWSASFDWLLKSANMAKVLEGNYNDKGVSANADNGRTPAAGSGYGKPAAANVRTTAELESILREQGQKPEYPDFNTI